MAVAAKITDRDSAGTGKRASGKALKRQQIIAATLDSLAKFGFAETTLASVAKQAGVSQGILIFHFKSKDALLAEALNSMDEEHRQNWRDELAKAPDDPVARVATLALADFLPKVCSRKKVAVWHSFYGEVRGRPAYRKLCGARLDERTDLLERFCGQALGNDPTLPGPAALLALQIDAFGDGLWLRMNTQPELFGRRRCVDLAFDQLRWVFPGQQAAIDSVEARYRTVKDRHA